MQQRILAPRPGRRQKNSRLLIPTLGHHLHGHHRPQPRPPLRIIRRNARIQHRTRRRLVNQSPQLGDKLIRLLARRHKNHPWLGAKLTGPTRHRPMQTCRNRPPSLTQRMR